MLIVVIQIIVIYQHEINYHYRFMCFLSSQLASSCIVVRNCKFKFIIGFILCTPSVKELLQRILIIIFFSRLFITDDDHLNKNLIFIN
jgi:hypothetical protein